MNRPMLANVKGETGSVASVVGIVFCWLAIVAASHVGGVPLERIYREVKLALFELLSSIARIVAQ